MNHHEIEAWGVAATEQSACRVRGALVKAHCDWLERVAQPVELHDLAPHALTGLVYATVAARAASAAAAELAILCEIWPRSIDAELRRVIRPGLRASR
jgi:hypothetical protein